MRKTTKLAANAFNEGINFNSKNTKVVAAKEETTLYLFGHAIAQKIRGKVYIDLCGWNTPTTRERLNGLPGVRVKTAKGIVFLNGKEWDGKRILVK